MDGKVIKQKLSAINTMLENAEIKDPNVPLNFNEDSVPFIFMNEMLIGNDSNKNKPQKSLYKEDVQHDYDEKI